MSRDYFSKPIQGNGRDSYDYGHTTLEPCEFAQSVSFWVCFWLVFIVVVMLAGAAIDYACGG